MPKILIWRLRDAWGPRICSETARNCPVQTRLRDVKILIFSLSTVIVNNHKKFGNMNKIATFRPGKFRLMYVKAFRQFWLSKTKPIIRS